jgi:hypothetical protein
LGDDIAEAPPPPGSPAVFSPPPKWPKNKTITTATTLAEVTRMVHLPRPPPRHPRTRAHDVTNITPQNRWIGRGRLAPEPAAIRPCRSPGGEIRPPSPEVIAVRTQQQQGRSDPNQARPGPTGPNQVRLAPPLRCWAKAAAAVHLQARAAPTPAITGKPAAMLYCLLP